MNEFELWTLNELKELLYFTSTINFIFSQEHPHFDAVNHCLIEEDFGLIKEISIIKIPDGNGFRLSFSVEFYCLREVKENEQHINDIKIEIYLEVREIVKNVRSGIGYLPQALNEWALGNEDENPLISSVINTIDGRLGMVKISQEYLLEHYIPFDYPPL